LERILEKVADGDTKITGQTVINALRAYASLTDDGRWIDPPSQVVFSTSRPLAHLPHLAEPQLPASADNQFLIDTPAIRDDLNSLETNESDPV
jgi:hypothetical protein